MSEPVRIKVDEKPSPNLRKLARALLALVQQDAPDDSTGTDSEETG